MDKIEILKNLLEELKNQYKDTIIYRYSYITKEVIELKIDIVAYSSFKDAYGKHKKELLLYFTHHRGTMVDCRVCFSINDLNELLDVGRISLYYYDENYIFLLDREEIPEIQKEYEIQYIKKELEDNKKKRDKEDKLKKIGLYMKCYNITKEDINKLNK